jgi:predicted NAD/FAD-binding protein
MRIGVIGAGVSGLVTSWLLQEAHEVVLFERNDHLGGHAHTLVVRHEGHVIPVDTAFQHFSHQMYPMFVRLLDLLGVPMRRFPVACTFHAKRQGSYLVMPPPLDLHHLQRTLQPNSLATLLQMRQAILTAAQLDAANDWTTTVGEFIDELRLTSGFKTDFFSPFLTALLGTSLADSRRMSARAALRYPVHHQPATPLRPFDFLEIEGGVATYVQALAARLGRTDVRLGAKIRDVRREGGRYVVQEGAGLETFDHLVVAAPARDATLLLRGLPGTEALTDALGSIEYIETRIAVHSDPSYMPPQRAAWSAVNMMYDGRSSEISMWPGHRAGVDVFKSWVTHQGTTPRQLHQLYSYFHPLMTPAYFHAQARLAKRQGEAGLWLAGSYTQDIDSHESGVRSAMEVAERLLPQSNLARLSSPRKGSADWASAPRTAAAP